ncbi:C25 family cysteine peptidase [[Eubacterium] cellulosolvens]
MKSWSIKFVCTFLIFILFVSLIGNGNFSLNLRSNINSRTIDIADDSSEFQKTQANTEVVEYDLDFSYQLREISRWGQTWDLVELTGGIYESIPGLPQVPYKSITIDRSGELIGVELEFSGPVKLSDKSLPPVQKPEFIIAPSNTERQPPESDMDNDQTDQQLINDYLSMNAYYPEEDYVLTKLDGGEMGHGSQNRYCLQIYPCKYNPNIQQVTLYHHAKIKVYFLDYATTGTTQTGSRAPRAGNDNTEPEVNFVILTSQPLLDELVPFAAWKTRKGLNTVIVDVNTIYENETFTGFDEPEELRNYIQFMHNTYGTDYVLLAGDYDTVPPRMCEDPNPYYGADDGEIPADSYYACISEDSTWDVDGDHIYGELGDLDDIYPDIAVGRIAINSEAKLASWVDEMINYECEPIIEKWTGKVILLGPNVHNEGDGAEQNEYFYENYLKYIYESFDKFYESSDAGEPFSRSEIIRSVNNGATFLNYLGHGGPTAWTYNYGYNKLFDKGDVNRFTNGHMKPVVYAMSCLTEWFDDPSDSGYGNFGDCIGETFTENIDNGGIGYIGSARTSVGSVGSGYGPFATGLQEDFIRQLSQLNFVLGEAFTDGKKHYSESFGHLFPDTRTSGEVQACWLEVNLLGDPTLPLWTQTPERFNISNVSEGDSLVISLKNESGYPVKDAMVALHTTSPNGALAVLKVKQTSANGEIEFDISGLPVQLNLTVTKINFIPYLETITIRDQIPPKTRHQVTPAVPNGENDWYVETPYINLTADEEAVIYYYWDDVNNSEYSQIFTEPIPVPEGRHYLYYFAIDLANNIEPINELQIKVDLTGPICELALDPTAPDGQHGWYIHQPKINITTEPEAIVFYAFDDDMFLKFSGSILAPTGVHELNYYSKDDAGNQGENYTVALKVDVTPPRTTLNLAPSQPSGLNDWYTSAPLLELTTEPAAETFYYWDELKNNITYLFTEPILCPEGVHELYYYSIDFAGCREILNSKTIKVDTIGPVTEVKQIPAEPDGENGYYVNDVLITLASEPNATINYYWDNGALVTYSKAILGLEGSHRLTYYSIDEAGNIGEKLELELKLDTMVPLTKIKVNPETPNGDDGWYTETPKVTFEMDPGAVVYYHFEYDFESIAPPEIEVPEGISKIYYHSIDEAGNIGEEHWHEFKVDVTPPRARLDSLGLTYNINDIVIFDTSTSEDNLGVSSYFIDYGDGTNSGWVTTMEFQHQYSRPGQYEVRLIVCDSAGTENEREETITLLITKERPKSNYFAPDNLILIIVIILAIFIVLSTLFVFIHRGYRRSGASKPSRALVVRPIDKESDLELDDEPEVVEAIILGKGINPRRVSIKCVGCGTVFSVEPGYGPIRCPGCGLDGEMKTTKEKRETKIEPEAAPNKFKCPGCSTIFKLKPGTPTHGLIKCPGCGVAGEI